ncbi:hypothetical protein OFO01_08235, partial [Campylobacter sp. JMF_01 NE2]|uniref:hypothetical protein n=1 Tax=unclassified Campylobacter TaxID=2593542 RepID=UPI0022E9AB78
MKALNKSRGSIVLAAILFAVGGVGIADAVGIEGATLETYKKPDNTNGYRYVGVNSSGEAITNEAKVTISGSGNNYNTDKSKIIYGGYSEQAGNLSNNSVYVTNVTASLLKTNSIQVAYSNPSSGSRQLNHNLAEITNVTHTGSNIGIWSARAENASPGITNYNTTVIKNSEISHGNLRGAITYANKGEASYNTLFVKDSTLYGAGSAYSITGAMVQEDFLQNASDIGTASYNQLIYDGVTTYTDTNKNSTSKYLFGGAAKLGEANNNRIYVRDLNKNAADSVKIQTNVVGGGTWRNDSGGAEGNIAVVAGDSKIANVYGGAVGFDTGGGATIGESNGTKNNLVILDLSNNGIIKENVYGGYISDTTNADTTGNAVYVLSGAVEGSIIGGNSKKENVSNTLILGKDKDNLGVIKVGGISGFDTLQFNAFTHGDTADKATLTLTNPQIGADLDGVAINVLKGNASDETVEVKVDGGGENAITNLTKNAIKYGTNLDKIAIITGGAQANNDIEETLTRSRTDEEYQAKYGIGDTFSYTYDVIDLNKEKNKKFYLIKSATSLQNIIPDPNNNINGIDINWQNKEHSGETLANGAKIVDAFQPDQIYKILNSTKYTRNLRGIYLENNDENLYFTGTDEITEEWNDPKFDTNEFAKFNQPSNTGNHVYVETNIQTGDLVGKTIYGGYSDSDDSTKNSVENNNIYLNK